MSGYKSRILTILLLCSATTAQADVPKLFTHTINSIGKGINFQYSTMSDTFKAAIESHCTNSKFLIINNTDTPFSVEAIESADNGTLSLVQSATLIPAHSNVMGILQPQTWSHGNISGVMSLKNQDGYLEVTYSYRANFIQGSCDPFIEAKSHATSDAEQYRFSIQQYSGSPAYASLLIEHLD